jgi:lysyl-tRNA synthetase class 2
MEFNELELERLKKLQRLRERGIEPYPARVARTHTNQQAIAEFTAKEAGGETIEATVVGRLVLTRPMGKASFAHIEDGTGRLQIYMKKEEAGEETYEMFLKDLDLGDFVEAQGICSALRRVSRRCAYRNCASSVGHSAAAGKVAWPEGCGDALPAALC